MKTREEAHIGLQCSGTRATACQAWPPAWLAPSSDAAVIDHNPPPWRLAVAALPHEQWVAWRRRSAELQGPNATADEVRAADEAAALEVLLPVAEPTPPTRPQTSAATMPWRAL